VSATKSFKTVGYSWISRPWFVARGDLFRRRQPRPRWNSVSRWCSKGFRQGKARVTRPTYVGVDGWTNPRAAPEELAALVEHGLLDVPAQLEECVEGQAPRRPEEAQCSHVLKPEAQGRMARQDPTASDPAQTCEQ